MPRLVSELGNETIEQDHDQLRVWIRRSKLDWIVARTHPGKERQAYQSLCEAGIIAYNPIVPVFRKARTAKKLVDVSVPMFPGYVFAGLTGAGEPGVDVVRKCRGVETILCSSSSQKYALVTEPEMLRIVDISCQVRTGKTALNGQVFAIGGDILMVAGVGATLSGVIKDINADGRTLKVDLKAFGGTVVARVSIDKIVAR